MLFNSLSYAVFLPAIVVSTFLCPWRWRWLVLLLASYYFYGSWEPRYLLLILLCTGSSFACALAIRGAEDALNKRRWLILALVTNLGVLFAFKYYELVAVTVMRLLESVKLGATVPLHEWLLPVGISFYTFQALGYVVDVYRGTIKAERHFGYYALYVAYFPQLVAGPIERASHLLPQLQRHVRWDTARVLSGLELVAVGLFKKVVIADRLALYVNEVYGNPGKFEGAPIVLATYLFAFQIFCDFSGYSDIAIGSARILGHDLMNNFDRPYAACSVQDFWRRWHISLSTWFRDYVYLPLGGNRRSGLGWVRNVAIVFVLSGLWHGAAWTFLAWGALHGAFFIVSRWTEPSRTRLALWFRAERYGWLHRAWRRLVVFHLVCAAWVFFRAKTFEDAGTLFRRAGFENLSWEALSSVALGGYELALALGSLLLLEAWQWNQAAASPSGASPSGASERVRSRPLRWVLLYALLCSIPLFGVFDVTAFIYFQF